MTTNAKPLIAIVDDDESVCRALHRLVRSLGMDAQTFSNGRDLLDLLDALPSFKPHCVILDVQMPNLNGLQVQYELRNSNRTVPVIFITAHDEVNTRERAMAGGAVAYLLKPFNDATFALTLRAALGTTEK